MNITITIDAPELATAINNLASAMGAAGNPLPAVVPAAKKEDKPAAPKADKPKAETKPEPVKEETKKPEPAPEPEEEKTEPEVKPEEKAEPGITLAAVRSKLSAYTSKGKPEQVEVMNAIQSLGVKKLTDVDPADYGKLLEAVGLSA